MNLVIWWDIPCKAILGVFKELYKNTDVNLVLITGELSSARIEMGWETNNVAFKNHILLNNNEWESKGKSLLEEYFDYLHIFNGFHYPKRMNQLIHVAINKKIQFGIFTEAPSNPYSGLKFFAANLYHKFLLPLQSYKIAKQSKFVFCLSGSDKQEIRKLQKLGWKKEKIVPFGYFSEDNFNQIFRAANNPPNLFCPGNLTHHKGIDILLRALNILKQEGLEFHCHITGKGPQINYLLNLTARLNLESKVTYHGVLKQYDFDQLQNQMDILVAPGRIEPWGIRINEAIQHGQVVVVSDKIGAKELILSSDGGKVFKSKDYKDLSINLTNYIKNLELLNRDKVKNLMYKEKIDPKNISIFVYETIQSFICEKPQPKSTWINLDGY